MMNLKSYDEIYIAVLRKEREHLLSLHDPHAEGTGHFNTAAGVLLERIKEISAKKDNWPVEYND
jgi:hypothetical protein